MDHLKHLKDMMTHRITQLEKQARRLSRMACASHNIHERRDLRMESKALLRQANVIKARYDKLFNQQGVNHVDRQKPPLPFASR